MCRTAAQIILSIDFGARWHQRYSAFFIQCQDRTDTSYLSLPQTARPIFLELLERNSCHARYEVLTEFLLKIQIFWDVTPFQFVNNYRRFEGTNSIYLQGQAVRNKSMQSHKNVCKSVAPNRRIGCKCREVELNNPGVAKSFVRSDHQLRGQTSAYFCFASEGSLSYR